MIMQDKNTSTTTDGKLLRYERAWKRSWDRLNISKRHQ